MSKWLLETEDSSWCFLNVIYYDGEEVFIISDSTNKYVTVEDINDPNNITSFPVKYYVDFAKYLRENEELYIRMRHLNLPIFHNFIS